MENKNSRYTIKRYYVAYAETIEEAIKIADLGCKYDDWHEQYEIMDWGEEKEKRKRTT